MIEPAEGRLHSINYSKSAPFFAGLFIIALIAFLPNYLSLPSRLNNIYAHLHAFTAVLWMLLLVAQPLTIQHRRLPLHRLLGRASYVIAPFVVISMLLLSHSSIKGVNFAEIPIMPYLLYLQLSLAGLFAICYALAIYTRHTTALHARFIVCTAFTLIDPVVFRLMSHLKLPEWLNYQWVTFALTDVIFITLIWLDRKDKRGRLVFPAMLLLFMVAQLPLLLGLTSADIWQRFARWFAALSLT